MSDTIALATIESTDLASFNDLIETPEHHLSQGRGKGSSS